MKTSTQLLFLRPTSALHTRPTASTSLLYQIPTLPQSYNHPTRRFFSNPLTPEPQAVHASLTLPHKSSSLYALISDISTYPTFLPYCTSSTITSWSTPHSSGPRYPRTATLTVGWDTLSESFTSRVYCVPNTVVEAVAGDTETSLSADELKHYADVSSADEAEIEKTKDSDIFRALRAKWMLREFPFKPLPPDGSAPQQGSASEPSKPRTEVMLQLEVEWKSAMYSALSRAAAPKVADVMIRAFERRAREVLGEGQRGGEGVEREGEGGGALERTLKGVGLKESP